MAPENDDEVIADSEGEEEMFLPLADKTAPLVAVIAQDSPHISQFTEKTSFHDSISHYTSATMSVSKPRPKPRPNYKSARGEDGPSSGNTSISTNSTLFPNLDPIQASSFQFNDSMMPSIADRAKMRSRDAKTGSSRPTSQDLSSDPPAQSKRRSRTNENSDIIELSSEDELSLPPARPKPRPKARIVDQTRISSPFPQPSLPMPTSSIAPSVLPPSDPPPPSSADYPPIVTLPEPYSDSRDPFSSPFPSPVQSRSKKKKRPVEDVDELDNYNASDSQRMPPPPAPFFASSSSEIPLPPPPQEVIDLSILPPTLPPNIGEGASSSSAKPKKPRKKKDGGEDDIEGTGSGKDKNQGKAKAPKEKKTKVKAKALPKVDVVIHVPSTDGKGKAKANNSRVGKTKEKEKEVSKSREIVEENEDAVMQKDAIVGWDEVDLFGDSLTEMGSDSDPQTKESSDMTQDLNQGVDEAATRIAGKRKSSSCDGDVNAEGPVEVIGQPKKKQKTNKKVNSDSGVATTASKRLISKTKGKGKAKRVVTSDDEEFGAEMDVADELNIEEQISSRAQQAKVKKANASSSSGPSSSTAAELEESVPDSQMQEDELSSSASVAAKENLDPVNKLTGKPIVEETPDKPKFTSLTSRYSIAPRIKSTPMSELIRRVNSLPSSPFYSPTESSSKRPSLMGTAYSPYLKSSKSLLSRIAPLHPNRRDPPPPLPPPPPRKKTKKELEMEEQWEEELVESVGGMTEWLAFSDQERKQMRKAKKDKELYGWEE